MKQWEYVMDCIEPTSPPVITQLNDRGKDGWELVAFSRESAVSFLIYKRILSTVVKYNGKTQLNG